MKSEISDLKSARLPTVFALGFFALAAQTLTFRSFLTVYEGNELGVGAFFSSWLLWVCAGALAGRVLSSRAPRLRESFEWLPFLYLPAFLLQQHLVLNSRALAGIEPYEMFPFTRMFPASLIANAPVSFVTGALFVLACEWVAGGRGLPVARVYMFESLGSFAGGVLVTAALAAGLAAERVFLLSGLVLALAFMARRLAGRRVVTALLPCAVFAALLAGRADVRWTDHANRAAWSRLLPADSYLGAFTTSQGKYLYGRYQGQFNVLAWESVAESIPNAEYASEVVALSVAQKPDARRVLVIGPGSFAVCRRFLLLPQVERVTWIHSDPEYSRRLLAVLPAELREGADRLEIAAVDARHFLAATDVRYDLVLLNLPDATALALNRYFTREFFALLKDNIGEAGVLCVRAAGGENYMGAELANLGASLHATLSTVFARIALKPGDGTWFLASDRAELTHSGETLRGRFASIEGAEAVYPPAGLLSLYLEDRAEFQLRNYREAIERAPPGYLVNTDRRPRAMLHALLFIGRHAGPAFGLAEGIGTFAHCGLQLLLAALAIYGALRLAYRRLFSPSRAGLLAPFDSQFLVASAGAAGLSLSIVLMFMFQARHGSIFLYIGLISSLYMLGLYGGSALGERLVVRGARPPLHLLPAAVALHLGLVYLVFRLPPGLARPHYTWLFMACGLVGGLYVPLAAASLARQDYPDRAAGSILDAADHLGGAAGAVLTGLVLLPVFGSGPTLGILAALLAVNLLTLVPARGAAPRGPRLPRIAACVLIGLILALLAGVVLLKAPTDEMEAPAAETVAPEPSDAREPVPAGALHPTRRQGRPRVADERKIRRMIEDGRLSDHEAQYYEKTAGK